MTVYGRVCVYLLAFLINMAIETLSTSSAGSLKVASTLCLVVQPTMSVSSCSAAHARLHCASPTVQACHAYCRDVCHTAIVKCSQPNMRSYPAFMPASLSSAVNA